MFADPITVTLGSTATPFNRVGSTQPDKMGVFKAADDKRELKITQNKSANRFRREVRLATTKVAADPISAVNKEVSSSIVFIIDEPRVGFSDAELAAEIASLLGWLAIAANRDKLMLGEI